MSEQTRSGYVALVGVPNVGKSTLMNHILGKKLSITSRKPQTTRHQVLGIKTVDDVQVVYVDTPGLHRKMPRAINRYMNRVARAALHDVNVVVLLTDARRWTEEDDWLVEQLNEVERPVILAINKVDMVSNREKLLPYIEAASEKLDFKAIFPISALKNVQLAELEQCIMESLPEDPHWFSPDQFTDRSDRFIIAEFVREKLMRFLGDELPYAVTVTVEAIEDKPKLLSIGAVIWVEKQNQKGIVIGKGGARLKQVGKAAREDLEVYFSKKVFLKLWVKVKDRWSDDEAAMEVFGYHE